MRPTSRSSTGPGRPAPPGQLTVLAFGTYDVPTHPRVGVLIDGLRAHGDRVIEVNRPLGIGTAGRVAMLRQPWRLPLLGLRLARRWAVLAVRGRRAYRRDRPDAVLVGYLGHFDVRLARLLFPRAVIVLDHLIFAADTAADRGESGSRKIRLLGRLDRGALAAADVVLVDTPAHAALVPGGATDRTAVVAVGAPRAWFGAGDGRRAGGTGRAGPVRVVFFGLFTPLQGTPVIGAALAALADETGLAITMIGTGQDFDRASRAAAANRRVTWLDWVPAAGLPAVVAGHDICLGIFGTGPKALRVVPNKVYQGAAAGCAIVTSDTPPQRAALGDAAAYVPPGDPPALAGTLRRLATDRAELARLRTAARTRAEAAFTPEAVVGPLRQRLSARSAGPR